MKKLICVLIVFLLIAPVIIFAGGKQDVDESQKGTVSNTLVSVLSPGLQVYSTNKEFTKVTGKRIDSYNQSLLFQAKEESGDLPPLEERLPVEPLVIDPMEGIGTYGGRIVGYTSDPKGWGSLLNLFQLDGIMRIGPDGSTPVPNVAKKVEFSEDKKSITIYLREGMKWSDGVPFTADDIIFTYNDVIMNEELSLQTGLSSQLQYFSTDGEPAVVEKIDDYTLRFNFSVSNPIFKHQLYWEAGVEGKILFPMHYYSKWHIKYNADANKLAKEKGFEHWYQLYPTMADLQTGPHNLIVDYPTLRPYVLKEKTPGYMIAERNPYYWKVDSAGNQLPYVDELMVLLNVTEEVATAKLLDGELDYISGNIEDIALLQENEEKGNYRVVLWQDAVASVFGFHFNQTYKKDPALTEIFQDVRFRRAMSLAINREEINEIVFYGLATPMQATTTPQTSFFEENFGRAYADFDPETSNSLLDEMGLDKRNKDNIRLRKDGEKLEFIVELSDSYFPISIYELVEEYWDALGIDVTIKTISPQLIFERYPSNDVQVGGWQVDNCTEAAFLKTPNWFAPAGWPAYNNLWPLWLQWAQSGGSDGEEPVPEIKENLENIKIMQTTLDDGERTRAGKAILRSQAENVWNIGTVGYPPFIRIVRDNLRNVPEDAMMVAGVWDSYVYPETFFFKVK